MSLPLVIDGRYMTDHYPGVGRYVFNLVGAMCASGDTAPVTLLVDREGRQSRFNVEALAGAGVDVVLSAGPRSARGQRAARRTCRRVGAGLYHTPHILSASSVRCPSVVTVFDAIPFHDPQFAGTRLKGVVFRWLVRRAASSASAIITLSQAARHDLMTRLGIAAERIFVTPAAADPTFRPAPARAIEELRRRLALPDRYVLYVGTARPHKNVPRLIEAWSLLAPSQRDGCRLIIAGPEDRRYREVRRAADRVVDRSVVVLGEVAESHLPALYSGARVFVHPSLWEGFGLPILEAMACGVPVACSRTPALVEVSGSAAVHFDPTDVADMAEVLGRLLADDILRRDLITRGFERAGSFSWTRTAALTIDVYRRAQGAFAAGGVMA